jgi:hypothetical protein
MNETSFQQVALGSADNVRAMPSTLGKIGARCEKMAVVVTHKLAGNLKQQSLCRMTQAGIGWTIEH